MAVPFFGGGSSLDLEKDDQGHFHPYRVSPVVDCGAPISATERGSGRGTPRRQYDAVSTGMRVMAQITPDPIMRIAMGFMAAKHLFVANEIGLFTGPAQGPATLHELAAICGIPLRTAGISADAMVSLGLSAGVEAFPRRRQRHWRPITIFRGIAGCSTLEAAPACFSSQSCDGTLRCAAPCSSCRCLRGGASSARQRARGAPDRLG
jgi:hypothetical protein